MKYFLISFITVSIIFIIFYNLIQYFFTNNLTPTEYLLLTFLYISPLYFTFKKQQTFLLGGIMFSAVLSYFDHRFLSLLFAFCFFYLYVKGSRVKLQQSQKKNIISPRFQYTPRDPLGVHMYDDVNKGKRRKLPGGITYTFKPSKNVLEPIYDNSPRDPLEVHMFEDQITHPNHVRQNENNKKKDIVIKSLNTKVLGFNPYY